MDLKPQDIKKLREATGAGVMDSKRALQDAKGDFDAAKKLIQERGLAKVEKRAGRATGAGLVESYVHNERIGVILDLRAETDFVVRSEPFRKLAHELAMQIAAVPAAHVDELLKQQYIKDETRTVKDLVTDVVSQVGENVVINQFYRIEI
ncbi:MAG: translation elongation factor Ts [Candidatus Liptonbacteria bacterium]|nr:translation elongation factor Ts [Candidatus Liptonbacteria bacterium]